MWERLPTMPNKIHDCVAIEINGKFYIAGGKDVVGKYSQAVYRYGESSAWNGTTYLNGEIYGNPSLAKSNHLLRVIGSRTLHTYDTINEAWLEVF